MSSTVQFDENNVNLNLDITPYGEIEKVSDTISKCRVRIFYKGLNRNRTFISEDFAQQLISSLPYAPIKGIFSYVEADFDDHGEDNSEGRIYGIIPERVNFAWERHLDKDGVEREYATADAYLFTGLYPEAKLIPGKPQSMEIFKDTFEGEWRIWEADGKPYFHFLRGSLVGLQTLGNSVEPCFEGAAFFSLYKEFQDCLNYIKKKEGKENMIRFSDNEKVETIYNALNPAAEGETKELRYEVLDVSDTYALAYDLEGHKYVRVPYEADSVSTDNMTTVYIMDVTEAEKTALEAIKAVGGTYELSNEKFTEMQNSIAELENKIKDFEAAATAVEEQSSEEGVSEIETYKAAIAEKEAEIETLKSEYAEKISALESEKSILENEKNDLLSDKAELAAYKEKIESEKKTAILDEFSSHLTDEQIESYKAEMGNYTVSDFKKELCTAAYDADPTMFSHKETDLIYKNDESDKAETGVIRILNKYKSGGNK